MINPILVPYKAEHLLSFVDRDGIFYNVRDAVSKEKSIAFTAILADKILGCAGVSIQWQGFGIAWVVFSKDIEPYLIWATYKIRRILFDIRRIYQLDRVELTVLEGMTSYQRWAEVLGFKPEDGRARCYTPNKENIIRMEMIK